MALTINFRNNSDLFAKISGVFDDKVITPNSVVEDKTIQRDENSTNGEKNISLYPTEDCNTAPSATLKVRWGANGFFVTKGESPAGLVLNADTKFSDLVFSTVVTDSAENELCYYESFPSEPEINLSLDKN